MRAADREVGELAVSIRRHGLLYPIIARPSGQVFELIAGHRRLEASKLLGGKEVPCLVRNLSDRETYELALTENVQRKTLDAVKEAEVYRRYVNDHGWGSVSDLARKIGKSQEYVSHKLLLLRLPRETLEKVRTEQLTPWQAQELVWVTNSSLATELSYSIVKHTLTVKQIRSVPRKIRDGCSIRDAVSQIVHRSGHARGEGSFEAFRARCLDRCIKSLEKAVSVLNKAIDDAYFYQDATLRLFLVEKRSAVRRAIDGLREERENHRKAKR